MTPQTSEITREQHHMLLDRFVQDLQKRGYNNIHTRYLNGFNMQPPGDTSRQSGGEPLVPDIYAEKNDNCFIFEVQLAETIGSQKTFEQLRLLSRCAKQNNIYFYLVVPEEIHIEAKNIMESLPERDTHKTFVMSL